MRRSRPTTGPVTRKTKISSVRSVTVDASVREGIRVLDIEAREGLYYTIDTLRFLTRRYPKHQFVWLMGADNLAGFHRWKAWRSIAALLPMAFVSGLMGPYMSPIPINASMGMLLSLAIAFVVTPWLSRLTNMTFTFLFC